MIKVVLDTNVVISGTFWTGKSFKILEMATGGDITMVISKPIIEEYDREIHSDEIVEKTDLNDKARRRAVHRIIQSSVVVEPSRHFEIVEDDPDDDKFIDCAVEGKADYIVSQDKHLFVLEEIKGIQILKPGEFLDEFGLKD